MATKLFLRNTRTAGVVGGANPIYYDMDITAGAASDTDVVDTVASGTQIQWTDASATDIPVQWISGRLTKAFTLTTCDISIWAHESDMGANAGGRFRLFKRTTNGTETEIAGGPFDDGIEFTVTTPTEMTWIGNVTDTLFGEDDRILLKVYLINVGTMGGPFTCTITFNAADAATGDSFLNLNENVTFKEDQPNNLNNYKHASSVSAGIISITEKIR